MDYPLITAVMVTSGTPSRQQLARVAIKCFLEQTYPNKSLLIINHGSWLRPEDSRIREFIVQRPPTLGQLRNLAFQHLQPGDWFISWDDDDWHHPDRMALQYAAARMQGKQAVALTCYTTVDIHTGEAFVRSCHQFRCGACCGTILCQVNEHRYPPLQTREDSEFALLYERQDQFAGCAAPPAIYLRLYHGDNTSGRERVMKIRSCRRPLRKEEQVPVRKALLDYIEGGVIESIPAQLKPASH